MRRAGRHFLQIPGPSQVPDRILRAIDMPVIDHRGPDFAEIGLRALDGLRSIFRTRGQVVIYPASGTGAWEAALVNTTEPGDRVLMYETGHFATLWRNVARRLGLLPELIEGDWRSGADPDRIESRLREDRGHEIRAVCVVHNETSTGAVTRIPDIRRAIDAAGHPALLMVDTISGLGALDYRHDDWGVDVSVSGSQKGLMLPPGLSFNAISDKAKSAGKAAVMRGNYWDWAAMEGPNARGYFPYTPATNMLYGLIEAVAMLHEEGLENVFARHARHGAATRTAVRAWGLETQCDRQGHESDFLTAVVMPEGRGADAFRAATLAHYDLSLGNGLSKLADKVFRIGHFGDFNDLALMAALSGVEMGLTKAEVPHQPGGAQAAMRFLLETPPPGQIG